MTYRELRNTIVLGLHAHLQIPVCLSSQVNPESEYPFVVYSSTAPYIPDGGLGQYTQSKTENGGAKEVRREQPTCTMSFTVCSIDRSNANGYILGEDEALDFAERAQGWFLHTGYDYISGKGITVVDVSNVQERSFLQVDEEARRYGFDVVIRYVREDTRDIDTISGVSTSEKGDC
ncbi:MAG: hypothetical protein KH230_25255 [Enterocloster asparagiformis]|nr:hypothetical protein [Enterocloster asparagiformis]